MQRTQLFTAIRLGTALLLMVTSLFVVGLWIISHYQNDIVIIGDGSTISLISTQDRRDVHYRSVGPPVDFWKWLYNNDSVQLPRKPAHGFLFRPFSTPPQAYGFLLSVPDWFAILTLGGIAVALLFERGRKFTVRFLLIVTT